MGNTLIAECCDCDGALTRNGQFTRRVFEHCPKLKVVSMHGVGSTVSMSTLPLI